MTIMATEGTDPESSSNNNNNATENEEFDEYSDIYKALYGDDDNIVEEEEHNDSCGDENSVVNTSYSNEENRSPSNGVQEMDASNNSVDCVKRPSCGDEPPTKKIKSERKSPERMIVASSENMPKPTTNIVIAEGDDEVDEVDEVPNTSETFMMQILSWEPSLLEPGCKSNELMPLSNRLQDVRNLLQFHDLDAYKAAFIPYILMHLWETLKKTPRMRITDITKFLSILIKYKSPRMKDGLELKCVSLRRIHERPLFRFGQLVNIRYAVQSRPYSNSHTISNKSYFGYILNYSIRQLNPICQSEENFLRLIGEDKRDSTLIEEVVILTKFVPDLFNRNDILIIAEPILCIHNYYLEARSIYKMDNSIIAKQILKPNFLMKACGITREDNAKFNVSQSKAIQAALDVAANSSNMNSRILVINGSHNSGKSMTLIEIVKQILDKLESFQPKILFTSSNDKSLAYVYSQLKKWQKYDIFYVQESEDKNNSIVDKRALKITARKLSKEKEDSSKIKVYEECIQYFRGDVESNVSVECVISRNSLRDLARKELIRSSSVIIGRIGDLCNDTSFYTQFSSKQLDGNTFTCCIIDDSTGITEPQLCSLLCFGINKFILFGYNNIKDPSINETCANFGLSRSLFKRYYQSSPDGCDTVINFVDDSS